MTTTTAVREQIGEFRALEEVLATLDQNASVNGSNFGRMCFAMYKRLDALRETEIGEWNATEDVQIYRCTQAALPYHTEVDGPCEVYTGNADKICDTCELRRQEELDKANAERDEYFAAKRRGEDV